MEFMFLVFSQQLGQGLQTVELLVQLGLQGPGAEHSGGFSPLNKGYLHNKAHQNRHSMYIWVSTGSRSHKKTWHLWIWGQIGHHIHLHSILREEAWSIILKMRYFSFSSLVALRPSEP